MTCVLKANPQQRQLLGVLPYFTEGHPPGLIVTMFSV